MEAVCCCLPQLWIRQYSVPNVRDAAERELDNVLRALNAQLDDKLTELEQRSGYSRRNLQLAFSQRFGCGPIQWIRRQRLDLARQHLLNPEASDTVAGICAKLGFRNLSAFSRDFHSFYGIRPSEVLREGRRLHG